jgi:hypothetical protein
VAEVEIAPEAGQITEGVGQGREPVVAQVQRVELGVVSIEMQGFEVD